MIMLDFYGSRGGSVVVRHRTLRFSSYWTLTLESAIFLSPTHRAPVRKAKQSVANSSMEEAAAKEEKQDDGAPKPKRAHRARKQGTASTAAAVAALQARMLPSSSKVWFGWRHTESREFFQPTRFNPREVIVRATDLTGLSGAGVEAKQEAQNKEKQDERDAKEEALEKNDQDLDGCEQFEAMDASRDGVAPDFLRNAVQHAHDYGVHGEGLLVAYNVDRCPDLTQPAAHGAKFFFDDDARKLFITCSASNPHGTGASEANRQLGNCIDAHNSLIGVDRLSTLGDGQISHFGDAPDVAVRARSADGDVLPLIIVELEMGNRKVAASRHQGHTLFERYPTLRALVVIFAPFEFNFDRVTDMTVAVGCYYREQAGAPVVAKHAFDLGTVACDRNAWMDQLGNDVLPPFDPSSWTVCRATPRKEFEHLAIDIEPAVLVFPCSVFEVQGDEDLMFAAAVKAHAQRLEGIALKLDLARVVQKFYEPFVTRASHTREVWRMLERMRDAVTTFRDVSASTKMPGKVTRHKLETSDAKQKLSMSTAFGKVYSGYRQQLLDAGVNVSGTPENLGQVDEDGRRLSELSMRDMRNATSALCGLVREDDVTH
ncbi:uncharacterized protein MONBRDRAFT_27702 [Monosiga brevicollis MX1]|uniref:Uncharacterized protein n=1 Tax=Monosiga brevicollis TaxID=81824 RepID=A9V623_MONBE|nr:uncharacterized protein MONBRDRAFT_27702 [Monosiga brevicollis MX1]EDQ86911.1 predicted protein [Monosiga brevicollis MX1]|eukprot:XP_001748150.1 hypothetical protein [Monosiga brevicollis MX1]